MDREATPPARIAQTADRSQLFLNTQMLTTLGKFNEELPQMDRDDHQTSRDPKRERESHGRHSPSGWNQRLSQEGL
jgi:hypothetical protein